MVWVMLFKRITQLIIDWICFARSGDRSLLGLKQKNREILILNHNNFLYRITGYIPPDVSRSDPVLPTLTDS